MTLGFTVTTVGWTGDGLGALSRLTGLEPGEDISGDVWFRN